MAKKYKVKKLLVKITIRLFLMSNMEINKDLQLYLKRSQYKIAGQ